LLPTSAASKKGKKQFCGIARFLNSEILGFWGVTFSDSTFSRF